MVLCLPLRAFAAEEPPMAAQEQEMFRLVNAERAGASLPALAWDDGLAAVARAHSADMAANHFFGHESPTTGFVADRLFAAKIRVVSSGENVAMKRTVEDAHAAVMASPGHRANVLGRRYARCGIGVVQAADGFLYITQVFSEPAPPFDLKTAASSMLEALNAARTAGGKKAFTANDALMQAATAHAAALAQAGKSLPLDLTELARKMKLKPGSLHMAHLMTWAPAELAQAEILLGPQAGQIGLGFAENTRHKELGYGIVWAVVIFTNE